MSFRWWYFYFRNGSISSSSSVANHSSLFGCFKWNSTFKRRTVKLEAAIHDVSYRPIYLFMSQCLVRTKSGTEKFFCASVCGAGSLVMKWLLVLLIGNCYVSTSQTLSIVLLLHGEDIATFPRKYLVSFWKRKITSVQNTQTSSLSQCFAEKTVIVIAASQGHSATLNAFLNISVLLP